MDKKKIIALIIVVFVMGLIITGSSYAFWILSGNANKNVVFNTVGNLKNYVVYDEGESAFSGELKVSNSYTTGGIHSTISVYKTIDTDLLATIHMDINEIGNNMKSSNALRWTVTAGDAGNPGLILGQGTFVGSNNGDTLTLVQDINVTTSESFYTIWVWIDAARSPSSAIAGERFDSNVWIEINQPEGLEDRFEITRADVDHQNISATVVDSKYTVVSYAVTTTTSTPSNFTTITPTTDQSKVYNLNTRVNATGTYYIWFKDAHDRIAGPKMVEVTEIINDSTPPTCTWGTFEPITLINDEVGKVKLTCTDSESGIAMNSLGIADIVVSGNNVTITKVTKKSITNGYEYTVKLLGTANLGSSTLTINANTIRNMAGLGNSTTTSNIIKTVEPYTVIYNGGDCDLDETTYGQKAMKYDAEFSIDNPTCPGGTFIGWTASNTLDTTNAKYGSSSADTTWSNGSTPVKGTTATYFKDLPLTSAKTITLTAHWTFEPLPDAPTYLAYYQADSTPFTSGSWANKALYVILSSNTNGTPVSRFQYSYDGLAWNATSCTITTTDGVASCRVNYSFANGNNYTIYYRAIDTYGRPSATSTAFTYGMDNVVPTGTVSATQDMGTITATLSDLNDNLSGVKEQYFFKVSNSYACNSTITGFTDNGDNLTYTFTVNNNATYTVCVKILDNAGNVGYTSTTVTTKVRAYLTNMGYYGGLYYASNTYSNQIQTVRFVDYIDLTDSVANFNLAQSPNNTEIKGWLVTNPVNTDFYDLYIGSDYQIYGGWNMSNYFTNLRNLQSINMSKLHFDLVNNMDYMFRYAGSDVTDFYLELGDNFNTSNVISMNNMFYLAGKNGNCSVNLGNNFDTSKVKNMQGMFIWFCRAADNFTLNLGDKFNTINVTNMRSMFEGVGRNSTNWHLNLGNNFNTSNVISMGGMFQEAGMYATNWSLDLGNNFNTTNVNGMWNMFNAAGYNTTDFNLNLGNNFDTSNVKSMYRMFSYLGRNATSFHIDLGNNFDTSNVTDMSYMFASVGADGDTWSLFNLGNKFNTSNVTNMSNMFSGVGKANGTNLTLDNEFDTSNVTNMTYMFASIGTSSDYTNIELGTNFDTSNVTDMTYMFANTGGRANSVSINLGNNFNATNVTNMFAMFYNAGHMAKSININLGNNFNATNVTNMSQMFYHTGYATNDFSIDLGNNFGSSNVIDMSNMFNNAGLFPNNYNLNLGNNFNTINVTNMADMFRYVGDDATNLYLNLGNNFNTSNVIDMSNMFLGVGYSTKNFILDLGNNFDTSNVTNMDDMFRGIAHGAYELNLDLKDKFNTSNVTSMNNMFFDAGGWRYMINFTLDLGNHFDTGNVTNMVNPFLGAGANADNFYMHLGNNFNASSLTNVSDMFSSVGNNATNFTLDLGDNFNVSNALYASRMFLETARNAKDFTLRLGNNFNAVRVENMDAMFRNIAENATNFTLDLGNNFGGNNATNMVGMFWNAGRTATNFTLNLGTNFNTSSATTMYLMFSGVGANAVDFDLQLGNNFNTINVTQMEQMFASIGRNATNFNLQLGNNFNTSNVTTTYAMFDGVGHNATNFHIDLGNNFDTSNVVNMSRLFFNMANATTIPFTLDLAAGDFNNVTDYDAVFTFVPTNKVTIYVKDTAAQNWIISKNSTWNTYFTVANVLIK